MERVMSEDGNGGVHEELQLGHGLHLRRANWKQGFQVK